MRYEIIKKLKDTNGFVSGEALSATLGITRAALWKHIKAMQKDGAQIESVTNRGYRLISPPSVPRAEYVRAYLRRDVPVFFEPSVASTNDTARLAARDPQLVQAVFIAGEQTAGKGRKGRTWVSAPGQGVYMTFLVRPGIDPALSPGFTLMAAVALCEAIEQTAPIPTRIKWPNDILVGGKKAAGILTESMIGMDGIEYIVCGAGVNTGTARFENGLEQTACSLGAHALVNNTLLAAAMIEHFFNAYEIFLRRGLEGFMPDFRKRSAVQGEVTVVSSASSDTGRFLGYDDTGAICIDCGGVVKRFVAGEVTLRGENGYV